MATVSFWDIALTAGVILLVHIAGTIYGCLSVSGRASRAEEKSHLE